MSKMKYHNSASAWVLVAALCAGLFGVGCQTSSSDAQFADPTGKTAAAGGTDGGSPQTPQEMEIIHPGDSLTIAFSDLPTAVPQMTIRVNQDGTITLIENQTFTAAGKSRAQLEKEIRERYVPNIFTKMTVTILPQEQLFYVYGEVKNAGQQLYRPGLSVLKAIAAVGGCTDFARRSKVTVTRINGKKEKEDCLKAQVDATKDLPVFPGDTIHVPRRLF